MTQPTSARRMLIKGAGLGLLAGALADSAPSHSAGTGEGGEIWSSEY